MFLSEHVFENNMSLVMKVNGCQEKQQELELLVVNWVKESFIRFKCEFEWMRIAKSKKSVQTDSVFFIILVKLFYRKNFINSIQKNFMEKWVWNFTNTHKLWESIIITLIIGSQ